MSEGNRTFLGRYRGPAITVGLGVSLIAAFAIPSYVAAPAKEKPLAAELKSQLGGTVAGVLVQTDQVVHKGDLLVKISDEDLQNRLLTAQKELNEAQTEGKMPIVESPMLGLGGIGTVRTVVREQPGPSVKLPPVTNSAAPDPKVVAALNKAKQALKTKPDEIAKLTQDVTATQGQLDDAKQAVETAQQAISAAADKQTATQKDLDRANHLFDIGAIAHKKVDAAKAAKDASDADLATANEALTSAKSKVDELQKQASDKSAQVLKAKNDLDALSAQVADLEKQIQTQPVVAATTPKPQIQLPKKRIIFSTAAPIGSTAPVAVKLVESNDPTKQKAVDEATKHVQALQDQVDKLGVTAPFDAKIVRIVVRQGDHITPGSIVIVLEPIH